MSRIPPVALQEKVLLVLTERPHSSTELLRSLGGIISSATLKRTLLALQKQGFVEVVGKGKNTKYILSSSYAFAKPIDLDLYFEKETDERSIIKAFNFDLLTNLLPKVSLFSDRELERLTACQALFEQHRSEMTSSEYNKELERLAIDLSWKSSQIEGNTYTLLQTELLLKEKEFALGKSKEEAAMLLNHKACIDFMVQHPDYLLPLSIAKIEALHSILAEDLPINRNIRKRRVGITGTNYQPLDTELLIREALEHTCELINNRKNAFEQSLLSLLLLSYIQPFADGNKRTARMICNGILLAQGYCPISFRTVDTLTYKKAM